MRPRIALAALALLGACAPTARAQQGDAGAAEAAADLPPAGYGTLNQDQIALSIVMNDLEIRVQPLDERVLRLLAPDAYQSLHELVRSRQGEIDSVDSRNGVSDPGLMLVSFFGRQPHVQFDPSNLYLNVHGQLLRPVGVIPYSGNFSSQQLDVRDRASAIYIYEERIPVFESFSISYGVQGSDSWDSRLNRLQQERARVMGRARRDSARSRADSDSTS